LEHEKREEEKKRKEKQRNLILEGSDKQGNWVQRRRWRPCSPRSENGSATRTWERERSLVAIGEEEGEWWTIMWGSLKNISTLQQRFL